MARCSAGYPKQEIKLDLFHCDILEVFTVSYFDQ